MGVSTDLIRLLHIAAETAMLDFSKSTNLFSTMCTIIKMYAYSPAEYSWCLILTFCRYEKVNSSAMPAVSCTSSEEYTVEMIEQLNNIAKAYRDALIIYLHIILDTITESSSDNASALEYSRVRQLISLTKDETITNCMQDMLLIPDDSPFLVGLVPLLFIVAIETKDPGEFDTATKRLSTVFQSACLGNVGTALELLYKKQRISSLHWRQVLECCEWDLIVT